MFLLKRYYQLVKECLLNMKTNKDVFYAVLGGCFGVLLVQFFMSYLTTGKVWEWSEVSHNVIPFLVLFLIVLIVIKEYNVRKINR